MARQFAFTSFLPVLVLLLAASCTSEMPGTPADTGQAAITFHTPATTRAAVDDAFPNGAQFSVWGWYNNNSTVGHPFDGETVTNNNGAWTYDGIRYWVLGATYKFYAVYPAGLQNVECSDAGVITVPDFDASATGDDAVDLMTASAKGIKHSDASSIEPVSLEFKHELVRISLNVKSAGDAITLTGVKLSGVYYKGDFDSSTTPQWSNLTANTSDDNIFSVANVTLTTDALSAPLLGGDLLLPPHDRLTGISLTFSYQYADDVSQSLHEADLSLATGQITAWSAGNHYNYTVNIPQNGTDVTLKVTVTDWTTEDYTVQW